MLKVTKKGYFRKHVEVFFSIANSYDCIKNCNQVTFSHLRFIDFSVFFGTVISGAPKVNFRKISVRKTIGDLEFSEHYCKIPSLPASPRIFEHLQNDIIAHF